MNEIMWKEKPWQLSIFLQIQAKIYNIVCLKIMISPTVGNSSGPGGNEITSTTDSHPPSTDFDRKPLHLPQYAWHTTAEIHEEYASRTRYTHLQKVITIKYIF